MTLTRKLILSFAAFMAVLLALSGSTLYVVHSMSKSYLHTSESVAQKQILLGQLSTARADLRASLRATILYAYAQKPDLVESNRRNTEAAADRALSLISQIEPLMETTEGREQLDQVTANFKLWREKFQTVYAFCKSNDPVQAEAYGTAETKSIAEDTGAQIVRLQELNAKLLEKDKADVAESVRIANLAVVIPVLLAITVAFLVLRIILGAGKTLSQLTSELFSGSEQLASAAAQISGASQSLAQGASEQAASLQETSSSTHEIVSMTDRNAENAKTAMDLMSLTNQRIVDGNSRLEEMSASMLEINASAQKISKIIKAIDEIAFQTNILALNAAVEAARAGEAGMGFAVVADEVRNLAQRCAQAAKDTTSLIEESIHSSQNGSEKLTKVAEAISGITEAAEKVKTLVTEVSMSSSEQARGLQQISKAVVEMEQVTQRTASGAEQSSAASQQLSAQSQTMRGIVRTLSALVDSAAAQHAVSKPSFQVSASRAFVPKKPLAAENKLPMSALQQDLQNSGEFVEWGRVN